MNTILRTILFALVLVAPKALACDVNIDVTPARPNAEDTIRLHTWGTCPDGCIPRDGQVSIEGNVITVNFANIGGCILVPQPWGDRVEVGRLAAGTYTIVVTQTDGVDRTTELGRKTLAIDPPTRAFDVLPRTGKAGTHVLLERYRLPSCAAIDPCVPTVTFGGVAAQVTGIRREGLTVIAPPHADGVVDVVVTDPLGAKFTVGRGFRYGNPDPADQLQILFPVAFSGPGAHGAQWESESYVRNQAPFPITVDVGGDLTLPVGGEMRLPSSRSEGGFIVRVAREMERFLSYSSHVRDTTRAAANLGTEMQVVDEDELGDDPMVITVPLDPRYRYTLRIFDIDAAVTRPAEVRAVGNNGVPAQVAFLTLQAQQCFIEPQLCRRTFAAARTVDLLQLFPQLSGATSVDLIVRVPGRSEDGRGWAFVSTTNNETQLVTTYTPKR